MAQGSDTKKQEELNKWEMHLQEVDKEFLQMQRKVDLECLDIARDTLSKLLLENPAAPESKFLISQFTRLVKIFAGLI